MAPVARGLADLFRVFEPYQRSSGARRLTVKQHVADLHELIKARCGSTPPALVGSSWGAMLGLAYAAEHPQTAGPLVLIGCGTFDIAARARMNQLLEERMDDRLRRRLENVAEEVADADERMKIKAALIAPLYSHELITNDLEIEECDARANHESWEDMVRLQTEGAYPAAFSKIESPVLMLHGAADPHPGRMISASLKPHLPQIQYIEWDRCGHYPWLERAVQEEFFVVLRSWLARHLSAREEQPSKPADTG